jgi:hypothetical protein
MADVIVPIGGWGRSGWGEGPWGQSGFPFATASVGSVTVTANADVAPTGLEATGAVGEVAVGIFVSVDVTGVSGTAEVGEVTTTADADVLVTGLEATGGVGPVLVWGTIVPNQNAGYNGVSPSQTPTWLDEAPSQTPDWGQIAA